MESEIARVRRMENTDDAAAFRRPQTAAAAFNYGRKALAAMGGAMLLLMVLLIFTGVLYYFRTCPLIDTVSPPWYFVIFASGLVYGIVFVILLPIPPGVKLSSDVITIPLFMSVSAFVLNANLGLEVYAFSVIVPQKSRVLAPITGTPNCGFRRQYDSITVQPYPGSREIRIKTTISICKRFEHLKFDGHQYQFWEPGHDCVLLDIDTGRNGIRRMSAPLYVQRC